MWRLFNTPSWVLTTLLMGTLPCLTLHVFSKACLPVNVRECTKELHDECNCVVAPQNNLCIEIACLCEHENAYCVVCMHANMCACGKIEIVSPVT